MKERERLDEGKKGTSGGGRPLLFKGVNVPIEFKMLMRIAEKWQEEGFVREENSARAF